VAAIANLFVTEEMEVTAAQITLAANLFTMVVVIVAAIKRPIPSYIALAALAIIVSVASGYEVVTGKSTIFATFGTLLLVIFIVVRIGLNKLRR